jgi:hypothetical protein
MLTAVGGTKPAGSPAQQFSQLPGVLRTCVATRWELDNERLAKSHRQPLPHQAGKSIGGTSVPAAMTLGNASRQKPPH